MKVFAASIQTETNTFSPIPTSHEMFEETYKTFRGQDPVNPNFWGAPMVEFQKLSEYYGDSYIEGLCVAAEPAGIVPKDVYVNYRDEILNDLQAQLPVDMVLLNLHGAMVAEDFEDCEGDIIESVRRIVGTHVPIGVELDLHTHLTEKMTSNSDLIVAFKLYPHTDVSERAKELYQLTRKIALKELKVQHHYYDCQMINIFPTGFSPIKEFTDYIFNLERGDPKIISISFIHGFIWGDVSDLGAKILVYTDEAQDADGQYAKNIATYLGENLYKFREETRLDLISLNDLQTILNQTKNGPLVIADFSDNPGLGGMGDATFILHTVLNGKMTNIVFATIYDPVVVEQAFNAGLNQHILITLGGNFGPLSGSSLKAKALVKSLNPNLIQTFSNMSLPLGKAAALEIGGNIVIVNSLRSQIYSPDTITNMGITLNDKRAIIVKSSEHFRAAFSSIASNIIRVSSPGVGNMNIAEIPYKNLSRSLWPINKN
ncbi:MAG: M81 family metallopeptidase [Gammaproteobacteria bacterium]